MAWSVTGNMIVPRSILAGCGIVQQGLSFGGSQVAAGNTNSNATEKFSISVWQQVSNQLVGRRYNAGCGTQNQALSFGGGYPYTNITEQFDGTQWNSYPIMPSNIGMSSGCGVEDQALSVGCYVASNITLLFNGTLWSTLSAVLNTGRAQMGSSTNGSSIQQLVFGGSNISNLTNYLNNVEYYNGVSWSNVTVLQTGRNYLAGCGTQDNQLAFGGTTGSYTQVTERYNGTNWSYTDNLNTPMRQLSGFGLQSLGLSFGGSGPTGTTEMYTNSNYIPHLLEYTFIQKTLKEKSNTLQSTNYSIYENNEKNYYLTYITQFLNIYTKDYYNNFKLITEKNINREFISGWVSTGNLITGRQGLAGCGTQDQGLSFGGHNGQYVNNTEAFNDIAWSNTGSLITGRGFLAGCGTQDQGLSFGGYNTNLGQLNKTEKFDGTVWSTNISMNLQSSRRYLAGCGTQNQGLSFGGYKTLNIRTTEIFNGTTWSTNVSMNLQIGRRELAGCGTQNQGLSFGGYPNLSNTEKFDGTVWSNTGNLITGRQGLAGCGTQSQGLSFGGYGGLDHTEKYDVFYNIHWNTNYNLEIQMKNELTFIQNYGLSTLILDSFSILYTVINSNFNNYSLNYSIQQKSDQLEFITNYNIIKLKIGFDVEYVIIQCPRLKHYWY